MNEEELIAYSKLARLISGDDDKIDFVTPANTDSMVDMVMKIRQADVSQITDEDIREVYVVQDAPRRDDKITEADNPDPTKHAANGGYHGYFKVVKFIDDE